MILKYIQISNYRSIENLILEIHALDDGSFTYGLIGVNEAGKSSILKAIALKNGLIKLSAKEFRNPTLNIDITLHYELQKDEPTKLTDYLKSDTEYSDLDFSKFDFNELDFTYSYSPKLEELLYLTSNQVIGKESQPFLLKSEPTFAEPHRPIFWTADEKYLISKPINLATFAANPTEVSIPLRNCFLLAGINDIETRIDSLNDDSTEIEQLQNELGEIVTQHIKTVWPDHPIKITFLISNGVINFHVKDEGINGKAKTADQRSDGFKQFVSFLLTVSAQNMNEELSNVILLLDEPETHLHPQAQEYLLGEFKKITQNKRNNIVMFATHSNYMIDKDDLSRNFRIEKKNDKTEVNRLSKQSSTYASVNYEVFGIPSTDYHNELYGKLHEHYQDQDPTDTTRMGVLNFDKDYIHTKYQLKQTKPWKGNANQATLPTYIRNCIHHPDNGDSYTSKELKTSIDLLITYLKTP